MTHRTVGALNETSQTGRAPGLKERGWKRVWTMSSATQCQEIAQDRTVFLKGSSQQWWSTRILRVPCGFKNLFFPHCFEDTISHLHSYAKKPYWEGRGRRFKKSNSENMGILPKSIVQIIAFDWNYPIELHLLFSFLSTCGNLERII